jgi:putative transposase
LDQSGFALMLALSYTWALKRQPLKVRTRWPSQGRVNLIGAWVIRGSEERATLYYRQIQGKCNGPQVQTFIEDLAADPRVRASPQQLMVIVLDNAPFHKNTCIKEQQPLWDAQNLFLRFIPSYCPKLNYIENIWRKVKGFLMPRRHYDSLQQLHAALLTALNALGAFNI